MKSTPPLEPSHPPETSANCGPDALAKTRILVAEDDKSARELICAHLLRWGYEVVSTADGTEAMRELENEDAPKLAILDWMMPGVDGIEICRNIRASGRPLYIIILTARGTQENIAEGLGAGADDYLVKPFDTGELQVRITLGLRVLALQSTLADRLTAIDETSAEISAIKLQHAH